MMKLWISLARKYLILPEGNPEIPDNSGATQTWNPDQKYLRYSLLSYYIGAALFVPVGLLLLCFSLVSIPVLSKELSIFMSVLVALVIMAVGTTLLFSMALGYACVHLELDMLRYTLTDRSLRLRRGVLRVEEVTLSYVNIQNVKYSQGPVQRYFGIADLIVETAGGGAVNPQQAQQLGHRGLIKGVSEPELLRDLILERVQRAKGAGLGVENDKEDGNGAEILTSSALQSSTGLSLLTEIRNSFVQINDILKKS
jgi:uncharacterized membrane protein YdbT with pleckstrin-like domain